MTAQHFIDYLENPNHLHNITYQELQALVSRYPYCQNLRYLLLRKSQFEEHQNYEKDLEIAATYSIDRSLLHRQLQENITPSLELEDIELLNETLVLEEQSQLGVLLEQKTDDAPAQDAHIEFITEEIVRPSIEEDTEIFDAEPVEDFIEQEDTGDLGTSDIEETAVNEVDMTIGRQAEDETIFENTHEIEIQEDIEQEELEEEIEVVIENALADDSSLEIPIPTEVKHLPTEAEVPQDTLIDRILNEWLPPEPKSEEKETKEEVAKVVTFDDFVDDKTGNLEEDFSRFLEEAEEEVLAEQSETIEEEPLKTILHQTLDSIKLVVEDTPEDQNSEIDTIPVEQNIVEKPEVIPVIETDIDTEDEDLLEEIAQSKIEQSTEEPLVETSPVESLEKEQKNSMSAKRSFGSWLKTYKRTPSSDVGIPPPIVEWKKTKVEIPASLSSNPQVEKIETKEKQTKAEEPPIEQGVKKVGHNIRNEKIRKLLEANEKKKKKKRKKKNKERPKSKKQGETLAHKSIVESEEIISQTLADLLAAQGYSEKAIKMYERLSLTFPEKSSFFAQKIKELNLFED